MSTTTLHNGCELVTTLVHQGSSVNVTVVGVPGPCGPGGGQAGPPGPPGKDGQIRFTGRGEPPAVIVGAEPGDTYLDLDTGNVFKLL
ncbi:MAG: hypothetical protein Q4G71_03775 [Pseudomonadota bacterium]|nr:hypothetical protein [Pseudomonadota bacterium]